MPAPDVCRSCGVRLLCVQTGSGKTFTIYGTDEEPGLTRRGIHELFKVRASAQMPRAL